MHCFQSHQVTNTNHTLVYIGGGVIVVSLCMCVCYYLILATERSCGYDKNKVKKLLLVGSNPELARKIQTHNIVNKV